MSGCRTFRFQLRPTERQKSDLQQLFRAQCELYNAALEERRGAWQWERRSVTFFDQCKTLTDLRAVRPEVLNCGVTVCRGTLRRLDWAFAAFYRRCRSGGRPGYPRFKSVNRFDSVQWEDACGWALKSDERRLRLYGIGEVKVHLHRSIRGTPKAITVRRTGRKWWVSVRCVDVPFEALPATGREVGIDLGVRVLMATSDGNLVTNDAFFTKAQHALARAQQALKAKQKGSKRRRNAVERVAALHRQIANRRSDVCHRLSRDLVNRYDLIAAEDLKITNMVRRPHPRPDGMGGFAPNGAAAKTRLNRAITDAGWGTLLAMIAYKAEEAGRTFVQVDPTNTSRRCAQCGHTERGNRHHAVFECLACGHMAHADTNAACNILRAGRAQQPLAA